jgi:hypothetical protein
MKVFISHSSEDKRFTRTLKLDLNENGINTWLDEDELFLGDSLLEKLETSINDSSHFLIVLSESSINSSWVQKELNKVLTTTLAKKIIPIKYKNCKVPESLKHLLLGDVSEITRITDGDRLKFNDDKYYTFIDQLVRSLKSKERELTKHDKNTLVKMDEIPTDPAVANKFFLNLRVKGFTSTEVKQKYIAKIKESLSPTKLETLKSYLNKPVMLPFMLKEHYPYIKQGDKISFKNKQGERKSGVFAGFRTEDDEVIILPVSIRNYLDVQKSETPREVVISKDTYELIFL